MILTVLARFWAKVDRRGPDDCWPWLGSTTPGGYGQIAIGDRGAKCPATHLALYAHGRPMTPGSTLAMHSCDNPPCVNPSHLSWGTDQQNADDKVIKGRHRNGLAPPERRSRGERHPFAKMDEERVRYIRSSPATTLALAEELGISNQAISLIRRRKRWQHVD